MTAFYVIMALLLEAILIVLVICFFSAKKRHKKVQSLLALTQTDAEESKSRTHLLTQFVAHHTKFSNPEQIAPEVIALETELYQMIALLIVNYQGDQLAALRPAIEKLTFLGQEVSFEEQAAEGEEADENVDMSMEEIIDEGEEEAKAEPEE